MATLPASFAYGFFQKSIDRVESLRGFASSKWLFDGRTLHFEDKICKQKGLVFRESFDHANIYSSGQLTFRALALTSSSNPVDQTERGSSKYLFRTQNGDQVSVVVGKRSSNYIVSIEVLPLELNTIPGKLLLSWGFYRSNSSSFIPLEFQNTAPNGQKTISETPVRQNSFGTYAVEMEFESYLAPFYLSFVLKYSLGAHSEIVEIKSHRHTNFIAPVGFTSGNPTPLGLSFSPDSSINFAFFSKDVENVVLCLYDDDASDKPAIEIELDLYVNRTGDIWHASMDSVGPFVSYSYRCKGVKLNGRRDRVLLDPYAKFIRKNVPSLPVVGELHDKSPFDWTGDVFLGLPMEKLVVYRLNPMHFTRHKSSKLHSDISGTFLGVTEKLHHLKDLGVNAILLEPVLPYNEEKGPYFPFHFFSPAHVYGPADDSLSTVNSLKEMIKKMHANGIEVYLEVVFTHAAENGMLQEIDHSYSFANGKKDLTGRIALNCNFPIVQQLIVDSLRYWVTEFHVDGFCFINASHLLKGYHGENLSHPPLVETIAFDPMLSKVKLIADFWDPCDLETKEVPFPHWKRWAEMNSRFSFDVRNFVRGTGILSNLATRLCGSGDIFSAGRGPAFSFNYVTKNFGLPLVDLVSFSHEDVGSELSWNCGEEGPTNNKVVLETRLKQIRNFLFVLFVSLGIPVLNMGDECGQSSNGSLAYGDRKPFNWSVLNTAFGVQITQFISFLSSLRERRCDLLQQRKFLKEQNIDWYDIDLSKPKWEDPSAKFLAMLLKAERNDIQGGSGSFHDRGDLYIAFNAGENSKNGTLPSPPEGMEWVCLVDTSLSFPGFFSLDGILVDEHMPGGITYEIKSYSSVLFEARIKPA